MGKKTERGTWQGHPVLDKEHANHLHLQAAIYEFQHGLSREDAEKRALQEYRAEHHAKAAAHHLHGMRASAAIGNHEAAERHHDFYSLHVKALGLDPMGPVPPEVEKHREQKDPGKREHIYDYKAHDADEYLVQPVTGGSPPLAAMQAQAQQAAAAQPQAQQPVQKAEQPEGVVLVKAEPQVVEVVVLKDVKDTLQALKKAMEPYEKLADLGARLEALKRTP
jgi:hypothetical protein